MNPNIFFPSRGKPGAASYGAGRSFLLDTVHGQELDNSIAGYRAAPASPQASLSLVTQFGGPIYQAAVVGQLL